MIRKILKVIGLIILVLAVLIALFLFYSMDFFVLAGLRQVRRNDRIQP